MGLFPNEESVVRLLAAILAEQDDEWRTGRRYFSTQSMNQLLRRAEPAPALLPGAAAA